MLICQIVHGCTFGCLNAEQNSSNLERRAPFVLHYHKWIQKLLPTSVVHLLLHGSKKVLDYPFIDCWRKIRLTRSKYKEYIYIYIPTYSWNIVQYVVILYNTCIDACSSSDNGVWKRPFEDVTTWPNIRPSTRPGKCGPACPKAQCWEISVSAGQVWTTCTVDAAGSGSMLCKV